MCAINVFRNILAFAIAVALSACSPEPIDTLRIASSPWPGYEPFYLARDIGYLDEKKFKLFELPSSDITMESFRNQSTDLATLTLDETLELVHDGIRLKVVQVLDISHGGDAVLATPDIKKLSDLKGKRIAIVNIPLGLYMLNRLLDKAGLERSDVEVFPMSESKQLAFYKQGKADVVVTFDPIKTKLMNEGMHVIFDSSDIPGEIVDILVAHENVYKERRNDVCEVIQQWHKTLTYMKTNKHDAVKRISKRLNIDTSEYDGVMSGMILPTISENRVMLGDGKTVPSLLKTADQLSEIMKSEGQLKNNVNLTGSIASMTTDCI